VAAQPIPVPEIGKNPLKDFVQTFLQKSGCATQVSGMVVYSVPIIS
jgi:hypothetical protein